MRRFHAGFMCGSRWLQPQPTLPLGSGSLCFYCLQPYHSIISLRIVRWCSVHILHNYIPDQLLIALLIARDYHRNFEITEILRSFPFIFLSHRLTMSVDLVKLNDHLAARSYVEGFVLHSRQLLFHTYLP